LYAFLISLIRTTSPAHLILFDFVALITLSEAYKFRYRRYSVIKRLMTITKIKIFVNDNIKSKFYSRRNLKQINFEDCLLPFSSELLVSSRLPSKQLKTEM
jgi:hypothetical protein